MDESVLRARSSNQRSHRPPRHTVARALTHQASPASIRAQGFSPLTGGGASRTGHCRTKGFRLAGLRDFWDGAKLHRESL